MTSEETEFDERGGQLGTERPRRVVSTDLDDWLVWTGAGVTVVAAVQVVAALAYSTSASKPSQGVVVPIYRPSGYYSLVLLIGVVLLAVARGHAITMKHHVRLRIVLLVAVGAGSGLAVAQVVGAADIAFRIFATAQNNRLIPDNTGAAVSRAVTGVIALGDAGGSVFATILAALLFRWFRTHNAEDGAAAPAVSRPVVVAGVVGIAFYILSVIGYEVDANKLAHASQLPSSVIRALYRPVPAILSVPVVAHIR